MDLERELVLPTRRAAADLEDADRAADEPAQEVGAVLDVDRRQRGVALHRVEGERGGRQGALLHPDLGRRDDPVQLADQVAGEIDEMAPDPDERPAARAARLELPRARDARVVAPVLQERGPELPDVAQAAFPDQARDEGDGRDLAVVEVHGVDDARRLRRPAHPLGVGRGVRQGLLAEDVLAGRRRRDRHRGVQEVGRGDADHVDVGARDERLPVRRPFLEAEPLGGGPGERGVGLGYPAEADLRKLGGEVRRRAGVGEGVETGDAARADQPHVDGLHAASFPSARPSAIVWIASARPAQRRARRT